MKYIRLSTIAGDNSYMKYKFKILASLLAISIILELTACSSTDSVPIESVSDEQEESSVNVDDKSDDIPEPETKDQVTNTTDNKPEVRKTVQWNGIEVTYDQSYFEEPSFGYYGDDDYCYNMTFHRKSIENSGEYLDWNTYITFKGINMSDLQSDDGYIYSRAFQANPNLHSGKPYYYRYGSVFEPLDINGIPGAYYYYCVNGFLEPYFDKVVTANDIKSLNAARMELHRYTKIYLFLPISYSETQNYDAISISVESEIKNPWYKEHEDLYRQANAFDNKRIRHLIESIKPIEPIDPTTTFDEYIDFIKSGINQENTFGYSIDDLFNEDAIPAVGTFEFDPNEVLEWYVNNQQIPDGVDIQEDENIDVSNENDIIISDSDLWNESHHTEGDTEDSDNKALYSEVLAKICNNELPLQDSDNDVINYGDLTDDWTPLYAFADLDHNGVDELLTTYKTGSTIIGGATVYYWNNDELEYFPASLYDTNTYDIIANGQASTVYIYKSGKWLMKYCYDAFTYDDAWNRLDFETGEETKILYEDYESMCKDYVEIWKIPQVWHTIAEVE
ncbi:hypothetical protein SAMN02910292_02579 [Lachnospiraceae bacterium XBB2008]|nr:hypothetical protein SAMN02910292_02579 [Lachnospiraceae bacterium XBB2008]